MSYVIIFVVLFFIVLACIDDESHVQYAYRVKKKYNIPFMVTWFQSYFIKKIYMSYSKNEYYPDFDYALLDSILIDYLSNSKNVKVEYRGKDYPNFRLKSGKNDFDITFYSHIGISCDSTKIIIPARTAVLFEKARKKFINESQSNKKFL